VSLLYMYPLHQDIKYCCLTKGCMQKIKVEPLYRICVTLKQLKLLIFYF